MPQIKSTLPTFGTPRALLPAALIVLQSFLAFAEPPVSVKPGTPNVWSMEQAHYILNRLRANKDGLQTRKPTETDLDPNATNGLRLDALQSFLGVGAGFDQIAGTQNKLSLSEYQTAAARRSALVALADAKRQELQQNQIQAIQLSEELASLNTKLSSATDPAQTAALKEQIDAKTARIKMLNDLATTLSAQVTELNTAAGQGAATPPAAGASGGAAPAGSTGLPTLATPAADYSQPIKDQLLKGTFDKLLANTAGNFGQPRLHASLLLDNFVQMQYEIVAKQLTTLRDQVGAGQRVVFLELPTSIAAAAQRKLPFVTGGEDQLAQAWWKLKELYLAYDRETSPCWVGGVDLYDDLQSSFGFKRGHDVDDVPKALKSGTAGDGSANSRGDEALRQASAAALENYTRERTLLGNPDQATGADKADIQERLQMLGQAISRLEPIAKAPLPAVRKLVRQAVNSELDELGRTLRTLRQAREREYAQWIKWQEAKRNRASRRSAYEGARTPVLDRLFQVDLSTLPAPGAALTVKGRSTQRQQGPASPPITRQEAERLVQRLNSNVSSLQSDLNNAIKEGEQAQADWEAAASDVQKAKSKVQTVETFLLGYGVALNNELPYFDAGTKAKIAGLEQPCRETQVEFSAQEEKLRKQITTLKQRQASAPRRLEEQSTLRQAAPRLERQIDELDSKIIAINVELTNSSRRISNAQRQELEFTRDRITVYRSTLNNQKTQVEGDLRRVTQEIDRDEQDAREIEKQTERLRVESVELQDDLLYQQTRIYAEFGGPSGLNHAFTMRIENGDQGIRGDSGIVRVIEVLPRQTALNVNSTHALVNTTAASAAMKYIFGLGLKVDYERMREKYDQFVQQEVFASGFGKGTTEFGWTFGPMPGTRVLNPGTRTTYAALAIPSNATGLVMESIGCSFHHNAVSPHGYPQGGDRGGVHCDSAPTEVSLGLPDRDSTGSFWVSQVRYDEVKPGERATVILQGSFSPETTVLVNGKRLTQLVGLGKPTVTMDFGPAEEAGTASISGSYEYVNEHALALLLDVPPGFKNSRFPVVTLISPSRTRTLNSLPLVVNGEPGRRLSDLDLLKASPPAFTLGELQIVDPSATSVPGGVPLVRAKLTGTRLSQLNHLWINGTPVDSNMITRVSDTLAFVTFPPPMTALDWSVVGVTGEEKLDGRTSAILSLSNPLQLRFTSAVVKPGSVEFDSKGNPTGAGILLSGVGFQPTFDLVVHGATKVSSVFVGPDQWYCTIKDPKGGVVFELGPPNAPKVASQTLIIPKKASDPTAVPRGNTTITEVQTQRTVTQK